MSKLPDKVAAGGEIDVQLAPLGDWSQTVNGKRITHSRASPQIRAGTGCCRRRKSRSPASSDS